jgi:hypothetical protein
MRSPAGNDSDSRVAAVTRQYGAGAALTRDWPLCSSSIIARMTAGQESGMGLADRVPAPAIRWLGQPAGPALGRPAGPGPRTAPEDRAAARRQEPCQGPANRSGRRASRLRALHTESEIQDLLAAEIQPALVKLDIEGAEVAALRGASAMLSEVKPTLICELHGTNAAVMDVLDSFGYRARTIERPDVAPRDATWWGAHILATSA